MTIVELRSRSRSGPGQEGKKLTWALTLFLVSTHPPPPYKLFSWLLRGMTQVGSEEDFQVDAKAEIKWDYRGNVREYFNESKIVW